MTKKKKIIVITSKTCPICDIQKKVIKKYGFGTQFIVKDVQTKEGQVFVEKMKEHGYSLKGTPTMVCDDFSCFAEGMRGPALLKKLSKDVAKGKKNPSHASTQSTFKSVYLFGLFVGIALAVFIFMFIRYW